MGAPPSLLLPSLATPASPASPSLAAVSPESLSLPEPEAILTPQPSCSAYLGVTVRVMRAVQPFFMDLAP